MNQVLLMPEPERLEVAPGVTLNCQQWGQGTPVVMCHGLLFGSMAAWYFSAALPLSSRHQVVLYDMRGHGRSDLAASGYDLATQTEDLARIIRHGVGSTDPDSEAHEPVILVGHSYGAMIALAYALAHPERVAKLVLVDAPHPLSLHVRPGLESVHTQEELMQRFHTQVGGNGRRAERLRHRLGFLLFDSTLRADIARSADFTTDELAALDIPVLCIYGRDSECRTAGITLAGTFPRGRIAWVDCGHYVTDDAPAEMLALLQEFTGS